MSLVSDLMDAFEEHAPEGISNALAAGANATQLIDGVKPMDCLIGGYLRSARFASCIQILIEHGAELDPLLRTLLFDDDIELRRMLSASPRIATSNMSFPAAFTSCNGVTPLHVCAEFNRVRCAKVLLEHGANVDARAETDMDGIGGQTPLFHTVNSIFNFCRPMMELLIDAGANLDVRLKGLMWGAGHAWETLVLDVTPISYAQCGLYAQFHRAEPDVYSNLQYLYRHAHHAELKLRNVPNRYLYPKK